MARKTGQRRRTNAPHAPDAVPLRLARELAEFRDSSGTALSCNKTIAPLLPPIPRLHSRSVPGPSLAFGRRSVGLTTPRLKSAIFIPEGSKDLHNERPRLDRFAVHVAVVVRVGSERLVEPRWTPKTGHRWTPENRP